MGHGGGTRSLANLEPAFAYLRAHPEVGWVRHKARMVDEDLRPLGATIPVFSGSEVVPADPALFIERIINSQPSCLAVKREVAAQVFPLVISPDLAFDADDAVLLARIFATGAPGYSLDEVLGYYRRHPGERGTFVLRHADAPDGGRSADERHATHARRGALKIRGAITPGTTTPRAGGARADTGHAVVQGDAGGGASGIGRSGQQRGRCRQLL